MKRIAALGFLVVFISLSLPAKSQMYNVATEDGIFKVWVQVENPENPYIVFIHGGPGYPVFPYLDNFKPLTGHFNLIIFEQRGTGKSYSLGKNGKGMELSVFLEDIHTIVEWTKTNFRTKKVILLSHSWGSNIGMLYAKQHPENLWAYVGTGQSVNPVLNERMCCRFVDSCARANKNRKALKAIEKTDTLAYTLHDALKMRKWVYTYGGIEHANCTEKKYINTEILRSIKKCKLYTFRDKCNLVLHSKYSGKRLWNDMQSIDLEKSVPVLEVPVFFLLGRHDQLVSSQLAKIYFDKLEAPAGKTLIWFENSAHRPMTEEPQKFKEIMIKLVLPLAKKE